MMATARQTPISTEEKYDTLSDLYLFLWKQLELASDGEKWLDLRPIDRSELAEQAERSLEKLRASLDPDLLKLVQEDYLRASVLLKGQDANRSSVPRPEHKELAAFKAYLQDQGLRYGEAADGEGATAASAD